MSEISIESQQALTEATTPDVSDLASKPFVGRWNKLSSETNWEKGRILLDWRNALIAANAPPSQYSDEAWANRVGMVTCQHVGRLRRVFERFGETHGEYPKLFWSHFWAALDWDDSELWLEGASQSRWSISQMCRMRAESMQLPADQTPQSVMANDTQRIESANDDGFLDSTSSARHSDEDSKESTNASRNSSFESSPSGEGPDFGDEESKQGDSKQEGRDSLGFESRTDSQHELGDSNLQVLEHPSARNPFEGLGTLPLDVTEAVDPLKLCILRYRANEWHGFSKQQMLALIDAMKGFCE
ncbi:MAG: hypothetical protein NTV29_06600 [Planctomycetota bacterium]|nr:hypothetical protein [Planctomycetota bacterium]